MQQNLQFLYLWPSFEPVAFFGSHFMSLIMIWRKNCIGLFDDRIPLHLDWDKTVFGLLLWFRSSEHSGIPQKRVDIFPKMKQYFYHFLPKNLHKNKHYKTYLQETIIHRRKSTYLQSTEEQTNWFVEITTKNHMNKIILLFYNQIYVGQ